MSRAKFLEAYSGETTEELIAKETAYRIDSLVLAIEQAIDQKRMRRSISREESYVLAIEGLEREVNNGGYDQFFVNSSVEFAPIIVDALLAIGCPKTAEITRQAIDALGIKGELTQKAIERVIYDDDDKRTQRLGSCDSRYFECEEPIADRLFEWIKQNRMRIRVGER